MPDFVLPPGISKPRFRSVRAFSYTYLRRIVDGDTLVVDVDVGFGIWRRGIKLRICGPHSIGFDAAESRGESRERGIEAANIVAQTVPRDSPFTLQTFRKRSFDLEMAKKGKYGRWLAYIPPPYNIAERIVELGLGEWKNYG